MISCVETWARPCAQLDDSHKAHTFERSAHTAPGGGLCKTSLAQPDTSRESVLAGVHITRLKQKSGEKRHFQYGSHDELQFLNVCPRGRNPFCMIPKRWRPGERATQRKSPHNRIANDKQKWRAPPNMMHPHKRLPATCPTLCACGLDTWTKERTNIHNIQSLEP